MQGLYFYNPKEEGYERKVVDRLAYWRARDAEADLAKRVRRYGEEEE